jgi:uncharacterized protein YcfL
MISAFFILSSCSHNQEDISNNEYNKIIRTNNHTKYINIIDNKICFDCCITFRRMSFIYNNKSHDKKILYVFPYIRKMERKKFLSSSLNIEHDRFEVYFNDDIYNRSISLFRHTY